MNINGINIPSKYISKYSQHRKMCVQWHMHKILMEKYKTNYNNTIENGEEKSKKLI